MERPLTNEEYEALSKDMDEVLKKHGANMSVKASILLMKVEDEQETSETD